MTDLTASPAFTAPTTVRRATPADARDVAAMVAEIAAHEDQTAHVHVDSGVGVGRELMAALAALAAPEQLRILWGVEVDNVGAQRFYERLGATLRHKVRASWAPAAYAAVVRPS